MTAWKIITPKSLQKREKGSSASIWLWSLQLIRISLVPALTGSVTISVTEPVKAGTLEKIFTDETFGFCVAKMGFKRGGADSKHNFHQVDAQAAVAFSPA